MEVFSKFIRTRKCESVCHYYVGNILTAIPFK